MPLGTAYFVFTNWDNGDDNYQGPNFTSPSATTDGALWIQTGTAAPVWLQPGREHATQLAADPHVPLDDDHHAAAAAARARDYVHGWQRLWRRGRERRRLPRLLVRSERPGQSQSAAAPVELQLRRCQRQVPAGGRILAAGHQHDRPRRLDAIPVRVVRLDRHGDDFSRGCCRRAQVADSGAFFANPGTDAYSPAGYAIDAIGDINPLNLGAFYYMPAVVLKTSLSGDANLDGKVDINDLTIVLAHYGQTGMSWRRASRRPTGKVDINDLTIVLAHYGQTAAASGPAVASAVPEPSALLLAAAALAGCLAYAGRNIAPMTRGAGIPPAVVLPAAGLLALAADAWRRRKQLLAKPVFH